MFSPPNGNNFTMRRKKMQVLAYILSFFGKSYF